MKESSIHYLKSLYLMYC